MDCIEVKELLSAYIDNELTEDQMKAVETHLADCVACRNELSQLKEIISLLNDLPEMELPEGFDERLNHALLEEMNRDDTVVIVPATKKKLSWRKISSYAAIFVIGIFTALIYTNGVGLLTDDNMMGVEMAAVTEEADYGAEPESASEKKEIVSAKNYTTPMSMTTESNADADEVSLHMMTPSEIIPTEQNNLVYKMQCDYNNLSEDGKPSRYLEIVPAYKTTEDSSDLNMQSINGSVAGSGEKASEQDNNKESGADDIIHYLEMIELIQENQTYSVISCEKESIKWTIVIQIEHTSRFDEVTLEKIIYIGQEGVLWVQE